MEHINPQNPDKVYGKLKDNLHYFYIGENNAGIRRKLSQEIRAKENSEGAGEADSNELKDLLAKVSCARLGLFWVEFQDKGGTIMPDDSVKKAVEVAEATFRVPTYFIFIQ